jgi:lactate racemase
MQIQMNYGRNGIELDLSDAWTSHVIEKSGMPIPADPEQAIAEALNTPVKARSLAEEAKGCQTVCILICDITRPVPNGLILPPVVEALTAAGIKPDNITILVATGLHRPNEGEELRELIGSDQVLAQVKVENHFAGNDNDHIYISRTERGTPVKLDRRFVQADLKIVTGLVEPHFMAGYSGGRKVIAPGIAHRDTITTFHNAAFLEHPNSANCVLEGNPLHKELTEIVGMLGRILAVNTVIDDSRNLSFVNYGEISESHAWAIEYIRRYAEIGLDRRFQTVITSGGGYPLDKTFYQTIKGLVGAMDIVRPGGNIIIFSECSEGLGTAEFIKAQKRMVELGTKGFLESIRKKKQADIDEWQTEMQLKPMEIASIHLFSDALLEKDRQWTGANCQKSGQNPDSFIQGIIESSSNRDIAIIPEGPYVIPRFQGNPSA